MRGVVVVAAAVVAGAPAASYCKKPPEVPGRAYYGGQVEIVFGTIEGVVFAVAVASHWQSTVAVLGIACLAVPETWKSNRFLPQAYPPE